MLLEKEGSSEGTPEPHATPPEESPLSEFEECLAIWFERCSSTA